MNCRAGLANLRSAWATHGQGKKEKHLVDVHLKNVIALQKGFPNKEKKALLFLKNYAAFFIYGEIAKHLPYICFMP